ncbi:L-ribulose-5-phosphate 3-epimerase [Trueperella pyogenes]|uniref:L-ribulose-5-phosphate 3-epimerase n=1 Tax=Trueperella pyogenes TaxID=1661 RepID=UPI00312B738A
MTLTTLRKNSAVTIGIYEKALPSTDDWAVFFRNAREAGFAFVDLSIDESSERLKRLDWDYHQRQTVREAAASAKIRLGGICLSAHRKIMPGSKDPAMRQRALDLYQKGIDFCVDIGIPVVQVAGYYAYYEPDDPDAAKRYLETLALALPYAEERGTILAIENVDGNDLAAIPQVLEVIKQLPSPWLQIYPDIGNIAEHGGDATIELAAGEGHMVALHVKDVLPGQPRRIPLGEGCADLPAAFQELARQKWSGRIMLEMWNDNAPDSMKKCIAAREYLERLLEQANIAVIKAERT